MCRSLVVALALCSTAGCGLISTDIADFDLRLPERDVTLDTNQWQLTQDENFPEVNCSSDQSICNTAVTQTCGAAGCSGQCEEGICGVTIITALANTFDLATESPELEAIDGQPLASMSIRRIHYTVTENPMTADSPALSVYVGPQVAMVPGHPQAELVGTIPPVPAGMTIAQTDVEFTEEGQEALARYMKEYSTPFNLIIGAEISFSGGDSVPRGSFVAVVGADAVAGL